MKFYVIAATLRLLSKHFFPSSFLPFISKKEYIGRSYPLHSPIAIALDMLFSTSIGEEERGP